MIDIRQFINKSNMFDLEEAICSSKLWCGAPEHWGSDKNKKNNTLQFLDAEEEAHYLNEVAANPNHPFFNEKIDYVFDENGYRKGIEGSEYLYCFGCCHTLGWGLGNTDLWSYKLYDLLKIKNLGYKNFGTLAGINNNIARTAFQAISTSKDNIKAVFAVFTPLPAIEYITKKNESVNFIPGSHRMRQLQKYGNNSFNFEEITEDYKHYLGLMNKVNCFYSFVKDYQLISHLCKSKNIPFYWYTHCSDILNISLNTLKKFVDINNTLLSDKKLLNCKVNGDFSRDGSHLGKMFHSNVAEGFYKLFNNGVC